MKRIELRCKLVSLLGQHGVAVHNPSTLQPILDNCTAAIFAEKDAAETKIRFDLFEAMIRRGSDLSAGDAIKARLDNLVALIFEKDLPDTPAVGASAPAGGPG